MTAVVTKFVRGVLMFDVQSPAMRIAETKIGSPKYLAEKLGEETANSVIDRFVKSFTDAGDEEGVRIWEEIRDQTMELLRSPEWVREHPHQPLPPDSRGGWSY